MATINKFLKKFVLVQLCLILVGGFLIENAYAGPKKTAAANLKQIKRAQKRLKRNKLKAPEMAKIRVATTLVDSDSDGVADVIENAKSGLDACDPDSDGDGIDDGIDDDGSSSSSSGDDDDDSSSSSSSGSSSSSSSDDDSSSSSSSG